MHGTHDDVDTTGGSSEHAFDVTALTRVEGEGRLRLRVHDGEVTEARLSIFEAPRYFEQLVVGRTPDETLDIVARICGICPIAYQMSAVHAFEHLFGVEIDPTVRLLRRLIYCGEWVESHALHVFMLHAPDFLGYPSALAMAADHRALVETGLAIKKAGNAIIALLGGRAIHPVSVRVGGFSRVPSRAELLALRPELVAARDAAREAVRLVAGFDMPAHSREPLLVALVHPTEYPFSEGEITTSDGVRVPIDRWDDAFAEEQHEGTNALHARTLDGRAYLCGPSARVVLAGDRLHPMALEALEETGLREAIRTNIHLAIVARTVEIVGALAEAVDIIDGYRPPLAPAVAWTARPGRAAWATEAPRGLIFHRYEVDERGLIAQAQIVPPTSQNQGMIEADLASYAPSVLHLPHDEATRKLEQLVRSYDPCISCATHFLDVTVEEA